MDSFIQIKDPKTMAIFVIVAIWTIFWKGLALWHSSRRDNRVWFVIILVVSTLGILEIIYLFFVLKLKVAEVFQSGKVEDK